MLEQAAGLLVAAVLVAALTAPHLLPLQRVRPRLAGRVWLAALGLRAVVGIWVATVMLVGLPQTELFRELARSSWHQVFPVIATHVDWRGDPLAHAAAFLPSVQLALSLLVGAVGGLSAAIGLRRMMSRGVGTGPLGSIIVADDRVLIGVPAMGRSQIFVSDSALAQLDEDELHAGLSHELGHLRRGHRPARLLGSALSLLSRALPGTGACERGLRLSLEREADEYAVRRTGDPLALASAICKAALAGRPGTGMALGGESQLALRLDQLLAGAEPPAGEAVERFAVGVAVLLALLALGSIAALGTWLGPQLAGIAPAIACGA